MGLIRAAVKAGASTLGDQWLELFSADSLDDDTLMVKGHIQTSKGSSNKHGNENVISNGSGLLVNEGQCAIIVDQGEIVEMCAEPGYYTYDQSSEPSIFQGNLADSVSAAFDTAVKRFSYGGDSAKDQRIYYFNTKEIMDNKFGTPNPIPFRVVDSSIGFDTDVSLRCAGVYSLRVCDPIALYKNVAGNVTSEFKLSDIADQLKAEFIGALQPAVAKLSDLELRPSQLPAHVDELCTAINEKLSAKWKEKRGLEVVSITLNSVTLPEEDQKLLKQAQQAKLNASPEMRAAQQAAATQDAMRSAAANTAGSAGAFMGMGMAGATGANAQAIYEAAISAQQAQTAPQQTTAQPAQAGASANEVVCPSCGAKIPAGSKFCPECGAKLQ